MGLLPVDVDGHALHGQHHAEQQRAGRGTPDTKSLGLKPLTLKPYNLPKSTRGWTAEARANPA